MCVNLDNQNALCNWIWINSIATRTAAFSKFIKNSYDHVALHFLPPCVLTLLTHLHFHVNNLFISYLSYIQLTIVLDTSGNKRYTYIFFKRPERYNLEVLSHSFICLPLPYMEGIVLICNIDLYCVIAIFNGTGDMFKR